jgi:hypothetical protein
MAKNKKTLNLNTRVSPEQKARLIALSGGNISKGVREALNLYFFLKSKEASEKTEALDATSISV